MIEEEYQQFGELKVLSYNYFVAVDAVGVKTRIRSKSFKGYLKAVSYTHLDVYKRQAQDSAEWKVHTAKEGK